VTGARRGDLAAEAGHRRRVDRRVPERQGAGNVTQLEPRQRRGEHDEHVTAAGRRDVGDAPGAEALEQLLEVGHLAAELVSGIRAPAVTFACHIRAPRGHVSDSRL
jgi:hypothetical protein